MNFIIYEDDNMYIEKYKNIIHKLLGTTDLNYKITEIKEYNEKSKEIIEKTEGNKIYILDNNINALVYNYESDKYEDIYDLNKLNSLDKYNVYLNGSVSLLKIINNEYDESKKDLIVFRDSYGSSLIPLLIDGYNSITVVDIRYIKSSMLKDYIDFNNKDVLFLYSTLLINYSFTLK